MKALGKLDALSSFAIAIGKAGSHCVERVHEFRPVLEDKGALVAAMLALQQRNPAETFLIEGHTDAVGSPAANLRLSDARAAAVASILTGYYHYPAREPCDAGIRLGVLKIQTSGPERLNRRVVIRRRTDLPSEVRTAADINLTLPLPGTHSGLRSVQAPAIVRHALTGGGFKMVKKLTDVQRVILATAADRKGDQVLPLAATLGFKAGTESVVLMGMLARGLVTSVQPH